MKIGLSMQKNPLVKCVTTLAVCSCLSYTYAEFQSVAQAPSLNALFTKEGYTIRINDSSRPMPNPGINDSSRPIPDPFLGDYNRVVTERKDGTVEDRFEQ